MAQTADSAGPIPQRELRIQVGRQRHSWITPEGSCRPSLSIKQHIFEFFLDQCPACLNKTVVIVELPEFGHVRNQVEIHVSILLLLAVETLLGKLFGWRRVLHGSGLAVLLLEIHCDPGPPIRTRLFRANLKARLLPSSEMDGLGVKRGKPVLLEPEFCAVIVSGACVEIHRDCSRLYGVKKLLEVEAGQHLDYCITKVLFPFLPLHFGFAVESVM